MSALPWIKVHAAMPDHEKSGRLAKILGDDRAWTHVLQLWLWTSQHQSDGDLSTRTDTAIGIAAGWFTNPVKFTKAIREVGYLDASGMLHDWDKEQGAHAERLRKERQRAKDNRDADKQNSPDGTQYGTAIAGADSTANGTRFPLLRASTYEDLRSKKEDLQESKEPTQERACEEPIEPEPPKAALPEPPPKSVVVQHRKPCIDPNAVIPAWPGAAFGHSDPRATVVYRGLWQRWHDDNDPKGLLGVAFDERTHADMLGKALRSHPLSAQPDPVVALYAALGAYKVDPMREPPRPLRNRSLIILLLPDKLADALDQADKIAKGIDPHALPSGRKERVSSIEIETNIPYPAKQLFVDAVPDQPDLPEVPF